MSDFILDETIRRPWVDPSGSFFRHNKIPTDSWYKEILRLDSMLTDAGIPHKLETSYDGWILFYPDRENVVLDAIEKFNSYGHECDTVEIMGLLTPEESKYNEVVGYLTAEDVFERIKKHYDEHKNN